MNDAAVLLQQIQSEPLSTLLASVRSRPSLPPPLSTLFHNLPTPQIIDVHSPSHTGKTHLLYFIVVQSVLPEYFPRHNICLTSSSSRAVLFIDCDTRFDIHRLETVLRAFIKEKLNENSQGAFAPNVPSDDEIAQLVASSLSQVYVFQPAPGTGVLATVKAIPTFLSHQNLQLGLICIDSLTTFHHALRAQGKLIEYYTQLASSLSSLSSLFNIPVITTSWALYVQTHAQSQSPPYPWTEPSHSPTLSLHRPMWRQYFPIEWLRVVDRRIILQKPEGLVAGTSLVDAEAEKERRSKMAKKSSVIGWLESDERRGFDMVITDDGIQIL